MNFSAAPCIDKSLGGPRITRENRSIDWRIPITGHPSPDVRWTKADNPIDDHRVVMRSAEDMEGLVASLNIAKCKVCNLIGTFGLQTSATNCLRTLFAKSEWQLCADSYTIFIIPVYPMNCRNQMLARTN